LIVTAVVNLMINAGLAWVSSAGEHRVPLWSVPLVEKPSTVVDTVGTFFLLPLITCLLITTVARHDVAAGRVPPLGGTTAAHTLRRARGSSLGASRRSVPKSTRIGPNRRVSALQCRAMHRPTQSHGLRLPAWKSLT